jgi:hypothetical protein
VVSYGLFGAAVALALVALVVAGLSRGVARRRRMAMVGLSLPVPLLIWLVVTLAPLAD